MRPTPQKHNTRKGKVTNLAASLTRITAMAMILTLIPVPLNVSAIEEQGAIERKVEPELEAVSREKETLNETKKETSEKEEREPVSEAASREIESTKSTSQETESTKAAHRETEPTKDTSRETETSSEEKKETSSKEETKSASETSSKETEPESKAAPIETVTAKENKPKLPAQQGTKPTSDDASKETSSSKKMETDTDSRGKEETLPKETVSGETDPKETGSKKTTDDSGKREKVSPAVEIMVPIYNYDVVNIVVPAKYAVALNPYELAVKTGKNEVSTDQVVSRKYGILNKSSTDKIVRITLEVEDLNEGKIVFVDSPEEAWEADKDTYAIYLAAVPADDSGVLISGENADCDTTAAELSDVEMNGAMDSALALKEGKNTLSVLLSKAVYDFEEGSELFLDEDDNELILDEDDGELLLDEDEYMSDLNQEDSSQKGVLKLLSLAPGEGGITAFTFTGVMNPRADWGKLLHGIRISAVYTYETATGEEVIVEGTGAMLEP